PALASGLGLASFVLYRSGRLSDIVVSISAVFAGIALLIPSLLLHFSGPGTGFMRRALRTVPGLKRVLASMSEVPPRDLRDPIALTSASVLDLVILALDAPTMHVLMRALGLPVPWLQVTAAFVVGTVAGIVSVTPAGFGGFEIVNIATPASFGVGFEPALAA